VTRRGILQAFVAAPIFRVASAIKPMEIVAQASTPTPSAGAAKTYYVDFTRGSDINDGIASPWKTVAKVNATSFSEGDCILFKGAAGQCRIRIERLGLSVCDGDAT
jgi:hypothetical protein